VRGGLPLPRLRGDYQLGNAAGAIVALETLGARFPVSQAHVRQGLLEATVAGRFQVLPGRPQRVLDVAHNPQAARALAATLAQMPPAPRTLAVFGMLADKDIGAVIDAMRARIDRWYVFSLHSARGASAAQIAALLGARGVQALETFDHAAAAYDAALAAAAPDDRVVVFGSFYTVGDILARLS
jgi:dihydrofolate synthase/folylpolyglutamate synthase